MARLHPPPITFSAPPHEHLLLRLRALNRDLRRTVEARRATTARQIGPDEPESAASREMELFVQAVQMLNPQSRFFVSDPQALFLLDEVDRLCEIREAQPTPEGVTRAQLDAMLERQLRQHAKENQAPLPLDRLESELPLSGPQMEAVVLCAAAEFDPAYEGLFAYILNDVARRMPCPELFCALADSARERLDRRLELARFGRLRLLNVLIPVGEAPTELRQELRLAPGLFDYLLEGRGDPADLCRDPDEIRVTDQLAAPPHVDPQRLQQLGQALRDRAVEVVGIWGPRRAGLEDVVMALAKAAERPLRRWAAAEPQTFDATADQALRHAIQVASVLDAILWVATDVVAEPDAPGAARLGEALANALATTKVRVVLTGQRPWQPIRLLAERPYQALELTALAPDQSAALWRQATPESPPERLSRLAERFPWGPPEVRAAARLAATSKALNHAGVVPPADVLEGACASLDRQNVPRFATLLVPRRGPDDLVLPEPLWSQVLEIADFHRSWRTVGRDWGFHRMETGTGGIRVLFTGDSGTGKTLAAEVIAWQLGRPLLKLDLSQVVSKWVGETEKHLDAAFREAEERDSVLCLDEADSLLGKRGEIRHGTDRYANLEVSYLLQRLEEHPGLIVMASNHKENIDPAFNRRFQTILAFPRPGLDERRKLWERAFPKNAAYQLSPDVKFESLARLDMTGAAIVDAARTAALLSVRASKDAEIKPEHVAEAVKRQFQRESRLLSAKDLAGLGGPS